MKRKGFTLVEVLIAMMVLAMVSVVFLGMFSGAYSLQMREKGITQKTFSLQEKIEQEIESKKKEVFEYVNIPAYNGGVFGLNNFNVGAYAVAVPGENHDFYTIIAKTNNTSFAEVVPQISSLDLKYKFGASDIIQRYAYIPTKDEDKMSVTISPMLGTTTDLQHYMVYWYASNPWFAIPNVDNIFKVNNAQVFPYFPDDYELVHQQMHSLKSSEINLPVKLELGASELKKLGGRHIVVSAVPVTKLALFGKEKHTDPIFLHSVEKTDDLLLHFDASVVDKSNIQGVNPRKVMNPYSFYRAGSSIEFTFSGSNPTLYAGYELEGASDSITYSGYGVKLRADSKINITNKSGDTATMFVIAHTASDADLTGIFTSAHETSVQEIAPSKNYKIYTRLLPKNEKIEIGVKSGVIEANLPSVLGILVYKGNKGDFINGIDAAVAGNFQNNGSHAYNIKRLLDVNDETIGSYALPNTVTAVLADGRHRQVPVQWGTWKDSLNNEVSAEQLKKELWNFTDSSKTFTNICTYSQLESGEPLTAKLTLTVNPCPVNVAITPDPAAAPGMIVGTELEYGFVATFGSADKPLTPPDRFKLKFSLANANSAQITGGINTANIAGSISGGTIKVKGKGQASNNNTIIVDLVEETSPGEYIVKKRNICTKQFRVYSLADALQIALSPKDQVPKILIGGECKYEYEITPRISGLKVPDGLSVELGIVEGAVAKFKENNGTVLRKQQPSGSFDVVGFSKGRTDIKAAITGVNISPAQNNLEVISMSDIPNLVLWLDAKENNITNFETYNNTYITKWKDISGKNNHFTAYYYPAHIGGGGVSFDGNIQYFSRKGLSDINYGREKANLRNSTVFVVSVSSNNGKGTIYSQARTNKNHATFQLAINSASKTLSASSGESLDFASIRGDTFAGMAANKVISVVSTEGIGSNLYANVSLYNAASVVSSEREWVKAKLFGHEDADFTIGMAQQSNKKYEYFQGTIYEVIVFNRKLSDDEIAMIVQYLRAKWLNN